ncbi:winged helix-turn-helix domain-containing protein [Bifidobacterium pullorum]|uniref:winged helix-turn-helix domain-containing protein n=1 Tax=Bifidobacterium pullorum TaxID=78448 RepID=UPI0009DCEC0C
MENRIRQRVLVTSVSRLTVANRPVGTGFSTVDYCVLCIIPRKWACSVVSIIHQLRKKIEPDPAQPVYIQTVIHTGYKFVIPKE